MERIDKFYEDISRWCSKNASNDGKCIDEMKKLARFLYKHQTELIPDSSKQKLLCCVELLYRYTPRAVEQIEQMNDQKRSLCEDFCKMPEGKLVAAKSKKKVMLWIDNLVTTELSVFTSTSSTTLEHDKAKWMVADISETGLLSLMHEDVGSCEVLEVCYHI